MMAPNVYDQISYTHLPTTETHPDRLAVIARLRGLHPPPVGRARILDLGANEGGCLIPMALSLPNAECVGIELAAGPVERGNGIIRELGLTNARLLQMDLLDVTASFGQFDYIVGHGLYAWTPPAVRDKVLAIARENLSPNGIAVVSYNTYPGGHLRALLREMMLFHAAAQAEDDAGPAERIRLAREILALMAVPNPAASAIAQAVAQEAGRIVQRRDNSIMHDYMSEAYQPVYFRDFVAHASRHGLAYVDDASVGDAWNIPLPPETQETIRAATGDDRILREQYLDFLRVRKFRCSLLCHARHRIDPGWIDGNAAGMFAASSTRETSPGEFLSSAGVHMRTGQPAVVDFLRRCRALWPEPTPVGADEAEMAVALFQRGLIELRTVPGVAKRPGPRPLASPLARYQARESATVSTLLHAAVHIADPAARRFLARLDGVRDRAVLARESGCALEQVERELERAADCGLLLG